MKFYSWCLFIFCLLLSAETFSQQYNFRNYSIEEGLAQSQVYAITEDKNGFIWFGTRGGGISLFDGIDFTVYTTRNGLSSDFINCFYKTGNKILIGTDEGLTVSDNGRFRIYNSRHGLFNQKIICITSTADNAVWIGTEKGLYHFTGDTLYRFGRKLNFPMERINALFTDRAGLVWAGTERGLFKISSDTGALKWKFEIITKESGLPSNIITAIKQDNSGDYWICTYGGGVCRYSENKFDIFDSRNGLPVNTVYSCDIDTANGSIWFATPAGACNLDPHTNKFATYTEKEGIANNVVQSLYADKSGNRWFGTSGGGVSRLTDLSFVHYTALPGIMGSWVYSICQDSKGHMWFGTSEGGVTLYDGKIYKRFSAKNKFTAHKVRAITEDKRGNIWFGTTADGVYIWNGKSFIHFTNKNGLSSNFINFIKEDSNGNIWLATAGGGISKAFVFRNKYIFKHIKQKQGLAGDRVTCIAEDPKGNMWATCYGNGISKISSDSTGNFNILNFKNSNVRNCRTIVTSSSGHIYAGTADKGISVFDKQDFINLENSEQLNSWNIYSLIFDVDGNLYAGTEKGIDRISFKSNRSIKNVKHFGKSEGFKGIEAIQNSVFRDTAGNLWFGSVKCATVFNPQLRKSPKVPHLLLQKITLFFQDINSTIYGNKTKDVLPADLTLPHDKNHLSFQFAGIELSNPEAVMYRWKLEGFDNNWSPASKRREAVYSNLPAGNYTFTVSAANEDFNWSNPVSYSFSIQPPFWKTWWFISISLITVVLSVFLVSRYNLRQLTKRNAKEKAVLEMQKNLLELEQKALRLQMNPHFLFNCLNSIKGLIAEGNSNDAKLYLTRFSKLMRLMLEYSRQSFITVENEIEYLRNYVELERLSLKDKVDFEVDYDHDSDIGSLLIPPMIIQPFVENALVHGISQKNADGSIMLTFSIESDFLVCSVEDDGIGREAAGRSSLGKNDKHASAAILVTQERLDLINRTLNNDRSVIEIFDLVDNAGNACGTIVKLKIPFKEK